jgi:ketosteroid isomerase-like protein
MSLLAAALMFTACGAPPANNATNKPANTANTNTASTAPVDTKADEAAIKKLMDDAAAALGKNDADAMDKIYADNYMLVNIDGSLQTRAERLAALKAGDVKYSSFAYSEPNLRFNPEGTGCIVIAKLSMKGTSKGKPIDGENRVTQDYRKTKDGWKQITAQATKIEAANADDKKADDKAMATDDKKTDKSPAAANK